MIKKASDGLKNRPKSGRWGFKQKVPRKVHVNTATREEKNDFKKRPPRYLWVSNYKKKSFTLVSLDESFFFYDSLVRRVLD